MTLIKYYDYFLVDIHLKHNILNICILKNCFVFYKCLKALIII